MIVGLRSSFILTEGNISRAAEDYLVDNFFVWRHAMRGLVPAVFTDCIALEDVEFSSVEAVGDLIQMNAALIMHEYVPVLYTSLQPGEEPPSLSLRKECI